MINKPAWLLDKEKSEDTYWELAKSLLERHFKAKNNVFRASNFLDTEQATDIVVKSEDKDINIAFRNRDYSEYSRYTNEVTFRSFRPTGQKTEFEKILEGFADYMLYTFSDNGRFKKATLVNLNIFRGIRKELIHNYKTNIDGTMFVTYSLPGMRRINEESVIELKV